VVAPGVGDAGKNSVVSIMIPSQVLRCWMPRINTEPVAHRKRAMYIKTIAHWDVAVIALSDKEVGTAICNIPKSFRISEFITGGSFL